MLPRELTDPIRQAAALGPVAEGFRGVLGTVIRHFGADVGNRVAAEA